MLRTASSAMLTWRAETATRLLLSRCASTSSFPGPGATPPLLQRLNKVMRDQDLCSRREADALISAGLVLVDGAPAALGDLVPPSAAIEVLRTPGEPAPRPVTIALHKPRSFISQATNPRPGQRYAWTLLSKENQAASCSYRGEEPWRLRKLGCCGRLDADSSGLLLFTQDGRVARRILGQQVAKRYEIDVRARDWGLGHEEAAARLRHGLELDEQALRPAAVKWEGRPGSRLRMTLWQGRYRQIRRMLHLVAYDVVRLRRVGIGGLGLHELGLQRPGAWRILRDAELEHLFDPAASAPPPDMPMPMRDLLLPDGVRN